MSIGDEIMSIYAAALTFYTAGMAWAFVLLFHYRSGGRWRFTVMGRHVMAFTAVDGLVFTLLASAYLAPALAAHSWYRWTYLVVGVTGIPWCITWRTVILLRPTDRSEAP